MTLLLAGPCRLALPEQIWGFRAGLSPSPSIAPVAEAALVPAGKWAAGGVLSTAMALAGCWRRVSPPAGAGSRCRPGAARHGPPIRARAARAKARTGWRQRRARDRRD